MSDADKPGDKVFDLDAIPDDLLCAETARWMRGIDHAFASASPSDVVFAHVAALVSAMRFLQRLPGFDCELVALRDLLARLDKLSVGQKQPIMAIVEAVKTPGRAPASYLDHVKEVRAVALVHAAMARGWTEYDANGLVAGELARAGMRGRRGDTIKPRALKAWSEKIKATDEVYRSAMSLFEQMLPQDIGRSDLKKFARLFITSGENLRH